MADQEDDGFTDLGETYDAPEMAMGRDDDEPKVHYPTICIKSDKPIEFPDGHFMMTAKARVIEKTASEREEDEPKFSYTLEICCVKPGESVEEEVVVVKDPVDELEKALKGETDGEE